MGSKLKVLKPHSQGKVLEMVFAVSIASKTDVYYYWSKVAFLPGFLSINPLGSCDLGKLLPLDHIHRLTYLLILAFLIRLSLFPPEL